MSRARRDDVVVRPTRPEDFDAIADISRRVYPWSKPWTAKYLAMHREAFPEGQMVAVERRTGQVVGMTSSLIVSWDDYTFDHSYAELTGKETFSNHDPSGKTLYGAEVMVHPGKRGRGVGKRLYVARRRLVYRLGLLRIRAGARLRGYHRYADRLTPEEYAVEIAHGRLKDPTVSFQLAQGFRILAVTEAYDPEDRESLGHAVVIEWLNPRLASPMKVAIGGDPRYAPTLRPRRRKRKRTHEAR